MLRVHGELLATKLRALPPAQLKGAIDEMLSAARNHGLRAGEDLDFAYQAEGAERFRISVYHELSGLSAILRHIPASIRSMAALGLPPAATKLARHKQGLVLVCGPVGSGKSTTLAAMIDHMNAAVGLRIVTLEDPIEFVHAAKQSQVIQREIGAHVGDFADGLKDAMHADADVILVGEMRDSATIHMALMAAEGGHLVFGALRARTAARAVERLLDGLKTEQRAQGKALLARNLRAVMAQTLVKAADARSLKLIVEIMVNTPAIANLIVSDKTAQIYAQIRAGRDKGMQSLDQALLQAIQDKRLDPDDAYRYALDKRPFQRFVTDPVLLPKIALAGS